MTGGGPGPAELRALSGVIRTGLHTLQTTGETEAPHCPHGYMKGRNKNGLFF